MTGHERRCDDPVGPCRNREADRGACRGPHRCGGRRVRCEPPERFGRNTREARPRGRALLVSFDRPRARGERARRENSACDAACGDVPVSAAGRPRRARSKEKLQEEDVEGRRRSRGRRRQNLGVRRRSDGVLLLRWRHRHERRRDQRRRLRGDRRRRLADLGTWLRGGVSDAIRLRRTGRDREGKRGLREVRAEPDRQAEHQRPGEKPARRSRTRRGAHLKPKVPSRRPREVLPSNRGSAAVTLAQRGRGDPSAPGRKRRPRPNSSGCYPPPPGRPRRAHRR